MRNVETKTEGDKLIITVDLSKDLGLSKSGKSKLIASTEGNASIDTKRGKVQVGLNVYQAARQTPELRKTEERRQCQ